MDVFTIRVILFPRDLKMYAPKIGGNDLTAFYGPGGGRTIATTPPLT